MEANILLWIQENLRADALTPIVKGITFLGDAGWIWILCTLVMLCMRKTRRIGCCTGAALVYDLLCVNVLAKNLFARTRPYTDIPELVNLIGPQSDYSFPSGHTAASFAFAVAFCMLAPKKYSIPVFVLATLISLSRLYVGVHYPTDVLGGAMIGAVCGVLAVVTVKAIEKRCKKTA